MTPQHSRLQVRSVADFLAAVPYLLGFHPEDSVVTVALQGPRVVFAARGDLLAPDAPRTEIRAALEHLAAVVARQSATAAVIIGYGTANQVDPLMADAEEIFAAYGVRVRDALRVADGRYFSYLCYEPTCCPPQGTRFDPTSSVIAAYATVAGHVALPNRAVLAAQLAPVDGPARQAMHQATERARTRLLGLAGATATVHDACPSPTRLRAPARDAAPPAEQLAGIDASIRQAGQDAVGQAFDRHRRDGQLTDDEAAWLTLLLDYLPVRDFAWANTDDRPEHVQLWTDLTRRAEPELVPAPASLLAFAAWRRGDGALANVALDRALDTDPTYTMALLLSEVIRRGVPPSALRDWPALAEATPCERRPDAE